MTTPITWLDAFKANTGTAATGLQETPHIIGLSNGNFLVAWEDSGSGASPSPGIDMVGKIFDAEGNVVRDAYQLNSIFFNDNEADFDMAATNDGGFIIAYVDASRTDTDQTSIVWQRMDAAGTVVDADIVKIENAAGVSLSNPQVAIDLTDNSFVLTYSDDTRGNADINAVVVDSQGVQSREINGATNAPAAERDGDVAVLANGDFVSVYETNGARGTRVDVRVFREDGYGGEYEVAAEIGGSMVDPQVAALANGNFVVTWNTPEVQNGDIGYRVMDSSGRAVGLPMKVAISTDRENEPEVVALPDGGFAIVWDNDTDNTIEARRFGADGTPDGDVFTVSDTGGSSPNIGVTGDGRILFTWQDANNEISAAIWDPRDDTIETADYQKGLNNFVDADVFTAKPGATRIVGSDEDEKLIGSVESDMLIGADGDDTLEGRGGNDTLTGGNGKDFLIGGGGSDLIFGGADNDRLVGNNGNDTLLGEDGKDDLRGGGGADMLAGSDGKDRLSGDGGNDSLIGGDGADTAAGGSGADSIRGDDGADKLSGGAGKDVVKGGNGDDLVKGDAGNDRLFGDNGNDTVKGGAGKDVVKGGAGNDFLFGGAQNDQLFGGGGRDFLRGDAGNDELFGDGGLDTAVYGGNVGRYDVRKIGADTYKVIDTTGDFGTDILTDIERIKFGSGTFDIDDLL